MSVALCSECHRRESQTWLESRHGMRVKEGLEAIRPSNGRLSMKPGHPDQALSCLSCHRGTTQNKPESLLETGVESCLGCHNDEHSLAYKGSAHFRLLQDELKGKIASNSGVACSTCHLPRQEDDNGDLWVNHNQNANLRPNEKMVRSACSSCHGVPFSLDALADPQLIKNNFSAAPQHHVPSVDWAAARE